MRTILIRRKKKNLCPINVPIAWGTLMRIPMNAIIVFVRARYHQSTNRSDNPTTSNNNHMKNKKKVIIEAIEFALMNLGLITIPTLIIINLLIH